MELGAFSAIALILISLAVVPAQHGSAESQIRAIVAAQTVAWNAGDATAYARDVSAEVSFNNLFGMVMYGAPAFTERHRQFLATFYGDTKPAN